MRLLNVLILCTFTGCSTLKEPPITVKIPVYLPCLASVPVEPEVEFEKLGEVITEIDAANAVKTLWLDRQALLLHAAEWKSAAAGCKLLISTEVSSK